MKPTNTITEPMKEFANKAIDFLTESVSPFNFVETAKKILVDAGFKQVYEKEEWKFCPGDKIFYTRNKSCIISFIIGKQYNEKTGCFKIVGAHTDSPSLRIAPNSYNPCGGYERYNIETYGGALWYTWLDRDLSISGKVVYQNKDGALESKIIRSKDALFFIPNCPPHLCTNRDTLTLNKEAHLKPIIATTLISSGMIQDEDKTENKKLGAVLGYVIVKELAAVGVSIKKEDIVDYDLVLYDITPPRLIGINKEFLSSGRLDNQGSSVPAVFAIAEAAKDEYVDKQTSINMIALFDNEEIGSMTYQGADSIFFYSHLKRIYYQSSKAPSEDGFQAICGRSFIFSADLAHAYNPNYAEKFQCQHLNKIQEGVVLKINCNGRYSSDSEGEAILKAIAKKANMPVQEFIVRQDSPCGTTIGPITTSKTGIRSVDIGIPQLAMHSIRELLGVCDLFNYKNLFVEFFKSFEEVVGKLLKE